LGVAHPLGLPSYVSVRFTAVMITRVALILALVLLPDWGGLINSFEQESTVANTQLLHA
jgi:hypothetical protein